MREGLSVEEDTATTGSKGRCVEKDRSGYIYKSTQVVENPRSSGNTKGKPVDGEYMKKKRVVEWQKANLEDEQV